MTSTISVICGSCRHEKFPESACYILSFSLIVRLLMAFVLGFANAKSRGRYCSSFLVGVVCIVALIDVAASMVPIWFSLYKVVYINTLDTMVSLCTWVLIVDVTRKVPLSVIGSSCSIGNFGVVGIFLYGIYIGTFTADSSYDAALGVCTRVRLVCAFVAGCLVASLALYNWDCHRRDGESAPYRLYHSESSNAMRVSLMNYPDDDMNDERISVDIGVSDPRGASLSGSSTHRQDDAYESYYSMLLVTWITFLFELAEQRTLTAGDIPPLPIWRASVWNTERMELLVHRHHYTLVGALHELYTAEYMRAGFLLLLKSLLVFVGPIMLDQLVRAAENDSPWSVIGLYIGILFLSKVVIAFFATHYNLCCQNLSVAIAAGVKGLLFRKILRLSSGSRQKYTIGNITNLYTVDVDRVVNATVGLHNFWALPLQIFIAMGLLFWVVSYAMLAGLGMIVLVLVINNIIAKKTKIATDKVMANKDIRMKSISEAFGAMLTIKLNAWEHKFEEKILQSREEELKHVWTVLLIIAMNVFLLWIAPSMVSVATLAVYAKVLGQPVTASKIFTALSLFKLLQSPLRQLPQFIAQFFQALTSLQRLQKFFDLEEKLEQCIEHSPETASSLSPSASSSYDPFRNRDEASSGEVLAEAAEFFWTVVSAEKTAGQEAEAEEEIHEGDRASFSLVVGDLRILPADLVVISGPVGSGKSSLCHALMGEMPIARGGYRVTGSIAYSSQQAWIQSATLRENILFGSVYDQCKYEKVIDACCLTQDFQELPDGDNTFIGQKGLNLSGGQKARCALARAVYADRDVYILDDVFAALDSIVARKVFERVVLGLLCKKTRIIVTHKPDIISHPSVHLVYEMVDGVLSHAIKPVEDNDITSLCDNEDTSSSTDDRTGVIRSIDFAPYEMRDSEAGELGQSSEVGDRGGEGGSQVTGGVYSEEDQEAGKLNLRVYQGYVNAAGGISVVFSLVVIQITWQILTVGSDYFITQWSRQDEDQQKKQINTNIAIYAGLALGGGLLVLARTLTVSIYGYRAAKELFEAMLRSLMYAPMHWMDRNPTGRLLNRFGDDQDQIDNAVPVSAGSMFSTVFNVAGSVITVVVITRLFGLFVIPAGYIYYRLMQRYLNSAREVQRIQSVSKSPMLVSLAESIDGLVQVRSFGKDIVWHVTKKSDKLLDVYLNVTYTMAAGSAWFSLRLQLMGAFLILLVAVFLFLGSGFISSGLVALSLSYMLSISDDIMSLVMIWSWFEQAMVCPERVLQYVDIEKEGTKFQKELFSHDNNGHIDDTADAREDTHTLLNKVIPGQTLFAAAESEQECGVVLPRSSWPSRGVVEYRNVSFRYQPNQTDFVLNGLSFTTTPAEKIGVVGRTGAGKSSLAMSLFRVAELSEGQVFIDGVDLSSLSLPCLRSAIEIVPQNPVLFKGTIRNYLDPFDEFSDGQIWRAVQKANLGDMIVAMARTQILSDRSSLSSAPGNRDSGSLSVTPSEALATELAENGENLSVGQRQMLVLSRALLRESKVLIMDEATASMDGHTDRILQTILRQEFQHATVLTIAHRIDSIITCDRVMVLSAGSIVEFDSPSSLLRNPNSAFRQLASEADIDLTAFV